jgi:hypothetical protein
MQGKKRIYSGIFSAILFAMLLISCTSPDNLGRIFYLSPSGNDNDDGSKTHPWRSIERLNRIVFKSGDTVLFEGSCIFSGSVLLDSLDSGQKEANVTIGSFGQGKAIIDGGNDAGMIIDNAEYFNIRDLVIKGNGRNSGSLSSGLRIITSENFNLENIEIYGFQHSGLEILGSKNARLKGISAHDNGFAGIHITGKHVNDPVTYDNENLYIGYSKAYNNPGDPTVIDNHSGNGILAASVSGGKIEYCEAYGNGWDMPWKGNGPIGIWIWDCTGFTIQYCLAHDNKTNPAAADGGGFDLDGGVSNSLIQYCISWSNEGAGYGLYEFGASKPWKNNVVRYCISRNDGIRNGGSVNVWKGDNAGVMTGCAIYNNTFINNTERGVAVSLTSSVPGFDFTNNIFVFSGSFIADGQKITAESFNGNCYWMNSSAASALKRKQPVGKSADAKLKGIFADPQLTDPLVSALPDLAAFEKTALKVFALKAGSPAAGKGIDPGSPFGFENSFLGINGQPVKHDKLFDIGAAGTEK